MHPPLWQDDAKYLILGRNGPLPAVRTGPDGRFRLTGVGRDRATLLLIEGESIEQTLAMVFTSSDPAYKPLRLPADNLGARPLHGPRFELTAAPAS